MKPNLPDPDPPTPQQLQQMARHINHEVLALMQAHDLYDHAQKQQKTVEDQAAQDVCQVAINCALESFLLHYRNLREFLNDEKKHTKKNKVTNQIETDDIKAKDYTSDSNWKTTDVWASDKVEGKRLHKRLAHISKARITLDNKWYPDHMEWSVLKTFEKFLAAIPRERGPWFEQVSAAIKARVRPVVTAILAESSDTLTVTRYSIPFGLFRFK
ncbi:MAG TPA: hypothetical protein VGK01_01875 [Candidatus Angelobacter sp.]|jgi:hypothetical protein